MKTSSLKILVLLILAAALILFSYVVMVTEIKRMQKEKLNMQLVLSERQNTAQLKIVEVQQLISEDRIVKLASDLSGLVRAGKELEYITIPKDQIKKIELIAKRKYD